MVGRGGRGAAGAISAGGGAGRFWGAEVELRFAFGLSPPHRSLTVAALIQWLTVAALIQWLLTVALAKVFRLRLIIGGTPMQRMRSFGGGGGALYCA